MIRMTGVLVLFAIALATSGCGSGAASPQTPSSPPPPSNALSIGMMTPLIAMPGSPDLTLNITGSNFDGAGVIRSRVVWTSNGTTTPLATTFVSSTQLTAVVPAALSSSPTTAQVSVQDWDSIENVVHAASNSVNFTVGNTSPGQPSIASLSPTSAAPGSPDLTLTITGSNFDHHESAVWYVNGGATFLQTTFVSNTQLTAVIPSALLVGPTVATVRVELWVKQNDSPTAVSNSLSFSVNAAAASTSAVSPTLVTLGPKGTQQFASSLNGNNASATWEVEEGAIGGSITTTGLYTVPAHAGTFHVIATFVADPTKNAAATVTVAAAGFTETGSLTTPRSGHTATLLADGKVLIVGGGDASAELFDPASGTFTPTGNMTTPRFGATATLLADGKVLISGGFGPGTSGFSRLSSAELYDPLTGSFSATGSMTDPRLLHTATLMADGNVLITGGTRQGGGGGAAIATAELYDPITGTFAVTGSMLSDRAQHTATLLASGEILIVGGWNGHAADSPDDPPWDPLFAELFEPSSVSFKAAGTMSTTRIGHSAIRLANGKVLALGGVLSIQNVHQQVWDPQYAELYDPVAQTFSSPWKVTVSRQRYTATLLANGNVLLIGGVDVGLTVNTAELFDPASGSLTTTGGLVTGRKGHTATRLNDGRVLVCGGTDANDNALVTAELYQ